MFGSKQAATGGKSRDSSKRVFAEGKEGETGAITENNCAGRETSHATSSYGRLQKWQLGAEREERRSAEISHGTTGVRRGETGKSRW